MITRIKDFVLSILNKLSNYLDSFDFKYLALVVLLIITGSTVAITIMLFNEHINDPYFQLNLAKARSDIREEKEHLEELGLLKNEQDTGIDLEAMRTMDSDGDTLSDYNELYLYHTSPYSSDSDGDGLGDKEEITQGKNPNCPEGQACKGETVTTNQELDYIPEQSSGVTDSSSFDLTEDDLSILDQLELPDIPVESKLDPEEKEALLKEVEKMSGAEIRSLLEQMEIESEAIQYFDDNTLKLMVKKIIEKF